MTKKDFFRIIIKLFGLYTLVVSVFSIPGTVFTVFSQLDIPGLIYVFIIAAVVLSLLVLLIYKADTVISLLKLDKGFDEERIDFGSFNSQQLIKLGAILIGGIQIIDGIPAFLSHTYHAFKIRQVDGVLDYQDKIHWATSSLKIILGYLLLTNYGWLAKMVKEKQAD